MSFAVTPGLQLALDGDRHGLERLERQRLGRQDVLDLARADAEGHRAEGAVRRGVAVAADDGDARHREAELRADDVDDALLLVAERVQADAELRGVAAQRLDLRAARQIGDRLVDVERRGVVVLGRDREIEAAHRAALGAQAVERLRAGHLVHEVQVDVDEVGLAVLALDDQVVVPDLLGEGAGAIRDADASALSGTARETGVLIALSFSSGGGSSPQRTPRRGGAQNEDLAAAAKEKTSDPHPARIPPGADRPARSALVVGRRGRLLDPGRGSGSGRRLALLVPAGRDEARDRRDRHRQRR